MSRRRPPGRASCRPATTMAWLAFPLTLTLLAAGCGSARQPEQGSSPSTARAVSCGQGKTAADVPVNVQVDRGHTSCATALAVMNAYARAVQQGLAPGNGGGGPVKVQGWTCQGFDTPTVLKTGDASKCDKAGSEILAVLPSPS